MRQNYIGGHPKLLQDFIIIVQDFLLTTKVLIINVGLLLHCLIWRLLMQELIFSYNVIGLYFITLNTHL